MLSAEHFGQYTLVMSAVVIGVRLFGALPMGLVRFYPAVDGAERQTLVRSTVWTQVFTAIAFTLLFIVGARLVSPNNGTVQDLVAVGGSIAAVHTTFIVLEDILRAGRRVKAYNIFRIWTKAAGLGAGLLLTVYFDLGVLGMLWGIVAGFLTALPFLWPNALRDVPAIGRVSLTMARRVIAFGMPLVVANLAAWVLTYFDRYLIQFYFGTEKVGLYSAAYSISEHSITLVAAVFMLSSTPLLTQVWETQGADASRALVAAVTRLYLLVSIPAVAGLSALAEPVMTVLTGPDFSGAYAIVPWVATGAFFIGLQHRFNQVLKLLNRTRDIMLWVIASGVLNIALNWWLLPSFGYTVAAVNTVISYFVLCAGQAFTSTQHYRWPFPWATAIRSGLAAAIMYGCVILLKSALHLSPLALLCLTIPAGVLVYGLGIWGLGEVSLAELATVDLRARPRPRHGSELIDAS
jgi:O-antigen/teichoic acid export membrane protein